MEGPHGREKTAASPESIAQRPPSPTAVTPAWRRWSRGKWGVGDGGVEAMTVGQRGGKGGGKEGQRAGNVGVKAVESGKVRGTQWRHGGCDVARRGGKGGSAARMFKRNNAQEELAGHTELGGGGGGQEKKRA
ncbi:hypothetical protein OsI_30634 [Oryza sativa Indica Group]|uniref:Uncharacterized protein n=1 Tax=Oryza sativa subsp. indica TaxID=39946 RepID=B8BDN2_ORYSI|nr:hypothetical protein OsI_30634 [Oryza sativa Indica Group]